jgi:hypothetical protein
MVDKKPPCKTCMKIRALPREARDAFRRKQEALKKRFIA